VSNYRKGSRERAWKRGGRNKEQKRGVYLVLREDEHIFGRFMGGWENAKF